MSQLSGSIRIRNPASVSHSNLHTDVIIRVECYALSDASDPTSNVSQTFPVDACMSIESFMLRRVKPMAVCVADPIMGIGEADEKLAYKFSDLPHGYYHIIAYSLPLTEASFSTVAYLDPSRQLLGWFSNAQNGDRHPWSRIHVSDADVELETFTLRAPHSFSCFRSSSSPAVSSSKVLHCTPHATIRLLNNEIPVLRYHPCTAAERGHAHGLLLAPYILDFWFFYLFEYRFAANVKAYETFVQRWVDPAIGFFKYPTDALEEAKAIVQGMKESGISLFLDVLNRDYDYRDVLSGYIETRTVLSEKAVNEPIENESTQLSHHCSQAVVYGTHTNGSVLAGRNMDGEIDIRKVTATHTVLFATDREKSVAAASMNSFRTISCMWPGIIGTLTGINETGLYLCENATGTQPGGGLVSGLTPVAVIQQECLRRLDGRTLTKQRLHEFLAQFISKTGWNLEKHERTTVEQRAAGLSSQKLPAYSSESDGGFSGPGSIFVVALPPSSDSASSSSSSNITTTAASIPSTSSPRAMVVECDRSHTSIRLPNAAPPFVVDCLIATNHNMKLGFDDLGLQNYQQEWTRAPVPAEQKCATLSALLSGSAASNKFTNYNVPLSCSTQWRYQSGKNRLEAWSRQGRKLTYVDVQDLLQVMCPGYTEHSFMAELKQDGSVQIHVAIATHATGMWDAPYSIWHSFEFNELFQ